MRVSPDMNTSPTPLDALQRVIHVWGTTVALLIIAGMALITWT